MILKYKYIALMVVSLLSFLLLSKCAHVMSDKVRGEAVPVLQLKQVSQDPESFKGKTVIWGGEIVATENQKDGTALVTIYQRPLTSYYAPDIYSDSEGRFILKTDKYLDPYSYSKGRKITIGGVILGGENKREGEIEYWYTAVSAKEIHLWDEAHYRNSDPFYYYNDPFWNCCPYYYSRPPQRHNRPNRLDRIPLPFD